jgi:hypothetical protein
VRGGVGEGGKQGALDASETRLFLRSRGVRAEDDEERWEDTRWHVRHDTG